MNSVILHQNQKWYNFINTIKNKKDNICSCCKKKKELMLLDFNHYKIEKEPWEQEEKSAFLVCNSCFKNNENIEEPDIGWYLLEIRDLGGLSGVCKKKSCQQKIRYEYKIYHPEYGYLTVGSTCVDYLTGKEKQMCFDIKKEYIHTKKMVNKYKPKYKKNKKGLVFLEEKYKNTLIRIYKKKENCYLTRIIKIKNKKPQIKEAILLKEYSTGKKALEAGYLKIKELKSKNEEHKKILKELLLSI